MAIITLTSDWGLSDYYVGAVKGVIYSYCPQAVIVDITHNITPFDLKNAGFIVKNCYKNFPEGTIHILGIDTEESDEFSHIVVKADGHYFIGCDNGIFSIIIGDTPYEAVTIEIPQDTGYFTFSSRDRFAKVASMLASGCQLSEIGNPHNSLKIIFRYNQHIMPTLFMVMLFILTTTKTSSPISQKNCLIKLGTNVTSI